MKSISHALDGSKVLFMLIMILHHGIVFPNYNARGYIVVEFFFMVSGYLIMRMIDTHPDMTVKQYFLRRWSKLYPHYLFSFIMMLGFTIIKIWGCFRRDQIFPIIQEALTIQTLPFMGSAINYPCWYLSVLIWGGLIVFAALKKLNKKICLIMSTICIVLTYGYTLITYQQMETWDSLWGVIKLPFWRGVAGMLLGAGIYSVAGWIEKRDYYRKYKVLFIIAELLSFAVTGILLMTKGAYLDAIMIVTFAVMVLTIVSPYSIMEKLSNNRVVKFCAKYEYAMYLNHALIIYCFGMLFVYRMEVPKWFHVIGLILMVFLYSVCTTEFIHYIERKIVGRKKC